MTSFFYDFADMDSIQDEFVHQPEIDDRVWQQDLKIKQAINDFEPIVPKEKHFGIKVSILPKGMNFLLRDNVEAERLVARKESSILVDILLEQKPMHLICSVRGINGTQGHRLKPSDRSSFPMLQTVVRKAQQALTALFV